MLTLDVQVHAYEHNHPGRPWVGTLAGPTEVTGAPTRAARDIEAEDVVGCRHILIADLLGRMREFADGHRIAADGDIDQGLCYASFISTFLPSVAQLI
jgi:hypothetical protein